MKEIVWRSELMTATGWTKRYFKILVKKGKIPQPDFPGVPGHAGKGGKEPGWNIGSLPDPIKSWILECGLRIEKDIGPEVGIPEAGKEEPEVRRPEPEEKKDIPAPAQDKLAGALRDGPGLPVVALPAAQPSIKEECAGKGESFPSPPPSPARGEEENLIPGQKLEGILGPERLLLRRINPQLEELGHLRAALVMAMRRDVPEGHGSRTEAVQIFLDTYNAGATYPEIFKRIGPISRATLYEWDRALRDGGVLNLVPNYGGSGISKITEAEKNFCLCFALNGNEFTKSYSIVLAKHAMAKSKIPSPSSPATLRRFLNQFEKECNNIWTLKRKGEKALNDECSPYTERDPFLLEVGEGLVGDGHHLNFQVVNPYTGKPCRPILVLFWDWRSAFPVGWEIMLTENIQAVSSGFRNAILTLGKTPKWVLLDNGKAFRADSMQSKFTLEGTEIEGMFARLGVNVHFAKAYNAQAKPIERFFRTFDEWFEKLLPSYVGASIEKKPAWMRRNEKYHRSNHDGFVPTIEQVNQMMLQWREFYGQQTLGARNGERPGETFASGRGPGVDPAELIFLMMSREVKTVNRNGISWNGRNWWCEGFYGYKGQALIKYSLCDFTQIYAFDMKGNVLGVATPREAVHPMISESENPKDYAEFKRQRAENARLKRTTIDGARLFDVKHAELMPFNGELNPPDVAGFIAKTAEARKERLLSPFSEEEGQSQAAAQVEEIPAPQRMSEGRFFDEYEKYDYVMKQEYISREDREWIDDFRSRSSLYQHQEFDDSAELDRKVVAQA